jgi:hypothetical protein
MATKSKQKENNKRKSVGGQNSKNLIPHLEEIKPIRLFPFGPEIKTINLFHL